MQDLDQVYDIVNEELMLYEQCRNDDKYLIWRVLRKINPDFLVSFDDFKKSPSFESITRSRRKIQNVDGRYLPTSAEVLVKRGISEEKFKRWAKSKTE